LATTIIPPQLRAAHDRGIQHYRATGEGPVLNKRIEITALHRSGREFPVELTIAPMKLGSEMIFSAFVRDITERKRAEAALQENEIRLRVMLKHAPEAIGMVDLDTGRFVEPNDVAARLCGVDQDTMLTLGPMDVSPVKQPDGERSDEKIRRYIDEAMAGDTPVFEWMHRSVKGVEVPCEIRLVRMPIPGRRLVRYSVTEISERKRAEKRREAFSALGERLSGAASVDDAAVIIMEVSDHLFGWDSCSFDLYSEEQDRTFSILTMDVVDGKRVSVPPTVTGATPSVIMRRTISEGAQLILRGHATAERSPEMIPFGDAGRSSASLMFVPIRNGGRVTGTLSIQSYTAYAYNQGDLETLQALADYCSAAIERIQAEHQFRSIFENAVEGIWRTAPGGRFLAANPALARMLGYASPEELIQSITDPARQLYVDADHWREFTQLLNDKDVVVGFETEFLRKDGGRIWISQSGRTVRDTRKTLRHYEGTLEEITERKRVESELLKALAKEKELGELKSNFVSMVSHEFRTPLEVIMSSGEILDRYLDRLKPEQRREHLQAIHKNVKRMAGLMEEVLVLTKVDAGKMEFKPMALDLETFCRRLVDEILSATSYQCPIEFQAENLPATAQGDESLLRHIFQNLLSNAVKYSPGGTPVRFSVKSQLGQALFRIEDQGLGIPAADQARLFQSFYRGKNVEHLSGTGLGLVIVKRCVQLHGGKIHFQSVEGKGTIFTVWLPLFGEVLDSSFETSFLARQTR
jgi:PAS domain S-box-containing protein